MVKLFFKFFIKSRIYLDGRRRGFSLVELLIVIVIIGVLTAVVVPKYAFLKDSAKVGEVKYGLAALYRAQKIFHLENGYYEEALPGFDVKSKEAYKIGFESQSWGAADLKEELSGCSAEDTAFLAGSVNRENKLINFTINHLNCLKKTQAGQGGCKHQTGGCISN